MSFLEMSIMGGIMALVITVLRAVFLNKLPKRTFVFLWEVAMLRLLLPLSIPAITSVYTLFAKSQTAPLNNSQITVINAPAITNAAAAGAFQAAAEPLRENVSSAVPVWTVIWGAGAVLSFFIFLSGYILIFRKYRYAEIVKGGYPAQWLAEQKLIRKVRIYRSEQTLSPLTYGIFRPVILLPVGINTDTEKSEQLDFILTHELTHIKRFDMLRKIIAAAVLCLHWFNPAVWVLFLLYNRDIELACDEAVVRKTGGDCRSAYAMALIGMEERQRGFSSLFSHFSKNAIEERIVAIMNTKNVSAASSAAACAALVGVVGVFGTSAAAEPFSPSFGEILVQAADGENETVKIPDVWSENSFSPLSSINAVVSFMEENGLDASRTQPTHTITAEQRAWLASRYDFSTMQMSVTEKYGDSYYHHSTKEYCNFIADLVYLNVYSAKEAQQLNMTPIPNSGLGLHSADEPSALELPQTDNIADAILALIRRDDDLIKYYMEKSRDPLRGEAGDKEYAEALKEALPLKQNFYELISALSGSAKTYLHETAVQPEVKNKSEQMTEIVDFLEK